jgi:Right handed beta helix region
MRFLRLPLVLCLLAPAVLRAQSNLVLIVGPDCYYPHAPIRTVIGTDATNISVFGNPSAFTVNGKGMVLSFGGPNGANLTLGQYSNTTAAVFNGSAPRLDLQGFACNSCNNLTGRFEIFELHTNVSGAIDRLWVTFSVQCALGPGLTLPGATGEVRFCSALAPPPPAPRTLHVPSEFSTIQAAIDDASYLTTDTVLVAPGNYPEAVTFRAKPVALVSEAGPDQTHIAPLSDSFAVTVDNDSDRALLSGFTLERFGFGVQWGQPTIISNIIAGSDTHSIVISSAVLRSNQFRGSVGTGLYIAGPAAPLVEGNVFEENGVGISANSRGLAPIIRNNTIRNNQHFGLIVSDGCEARVIQNLIVGNRSGVTLDGHFFSSPYTPPVTNGPLLLNNTIVSELSSPGSGLSLRNFGDTRPTILNNIVVGSPALIVTGTNAAVFDLVQSNDFFSTFGSTYFLMSRPSLELSNNISGDPLFVCLEGDYHLQPISPGIDAGTNSVSNLPPTDLEGRQRIITGSSSPVVDLGAFEFDPAQTPPVPCVTIICPRDILIHAPFGLPSVIVHYAKPYASAGATVTCSPPPGSAFPPGTNVVTCSAVSTNGSNWCTFNVIVLVRPPNDDFDDATLIPPLPYTNILDVTGATGDFDDPSSCLSGRANTVWYKIKTSKRTDVYLSTLGSDCYPTLSVYTGTRDNLKPVVCDNFSVKFNALPTRTYHVMVSSPIGVPAGHLELRGYSRPPFKATVVLKSMARVEPTVHGALLIGNVRTSRHLLVSISGSLEQKQRSGQIVRSEFLNGVDCHGQATWSTVARGAFVNGLADVHLHISAYDPETGEYVNTERSGKVMLWAPPALRPGGGGF